MERVHKQLHMIFDLPEFVWSTEGQQFPDVAFKPGYRTGETRQCVVLNCVGDRFLKNVVLSDMHVTFGGGGTAEEAQREVPQVAGNILLVLRQLSVCMAAKSEA